MSHKPQKVKVYGTNSTKDVRARLIDILQERVMYHKDKFIAPILHDEMSGMEVKNNGKCEHSANTHDDQVFSYLMALYVWYDGKNLAENFGIVKNTLKTDDAEEMEEAGFEDQLEKGSNIDLRKLNSDPNEFDEQLDADLEWLEKDMVNTKSVDKFEEETYRQEYAIRQRMLSSDPRLRRNFEEADYGIDTTTTFGYSNYYTNLPDSVFTNGDIIGVDDFDDYDILDSRDAAHQLQVGPRLSGNLANLYNRMQKKINRSLFLY